MKNARAAAAPFIAASVLLTVVPSVSAQGTRDTVKLKDIVITATRIPVPIAATGSSVTVLSGVYLRARGVRRVVDALRTVPGVAVAQLGGTGAVASVFMRGGESNYVQVLVDGVQVNDPGGSYDWAHLTTDDVERIEIVRGPVSVLYGSDAVAGVVQIFTRGGTDRLSGRAQVLGGRGERVGAQADGSYNALDWNASLGGGTTLTGTPLRGAALRFAGTASRVSSDGAYAFNNEYDNTTLGGRLSLTRAGRGDASLTARHIDQTFHYPTNGGGAVVDHNQFTDGKSLALGMNAGYFLTSHMEARAQLASYRSETGGSNPADNAGDGFSASTADVTRRTAELRLNAYLAHNLTASAGVEGERQKGATTFDSDGPFGPFNAQTSDRRNNTAVYAQVVAAPLSALTGSAGLRIDDNNQFGRFTTGRAAASLRLTDNLRVRGAYGTGFKEPTFLEAYAVGFGNVGDPDLQPEESRSGEIGAEVTLGRSLRNAKIGATWFDQRFRNLIQYTFAVPAGQPNYYNVGAATARGLETTASLNVARDVTLEAQYSWVDTNVKDEGFGDDRSFLADERLLRRPTHQASVTASSRFLDVLFASASVIYTGERDDLDFTDPADFAGRRATLDSHVTVDASLRYRLPILGPDASLLVRASNLFDRRYDEVYNFPAAGRLVWIGAAIDTGR